MKTVEKIINIGDSEYHYSSGYYTMNKWVDNDTLILARSKNATIGVRENPFEDAVEVVMYSFKDNSVKVLCNDAMNFASHVVWGRKVYYTDGIRLKRIDIDSGKIDVVYENKEYREDECKGIMYKGEMSYMRDPHITNDGNFISVTIPHENEKSDFIRINTKTLEAETVYKRKFEAPFFWASHVMICPENPDLFFFVHEGVTFYIPNRLWLVDVKSGKEWNIAKQKLTDDGELADCYGHEMWAPDGKGMYFVKYKCSPVPPKGVCYVDVQTGKSELLYSAFGYWHVGVSSDGQYLLADTQTGKDYSEVILIDRNDDSEILIDNAKTDWRHPCHPHPQLSLDNSKLAYTALDDNGRVCVKIAYIK